MQIKPIVIRYCSNLNSSTNLESYTSGSGTEESADESEAPESSSSVNTSNSAQDAEEAENNNSKQQKILKLNGVLKT